jgi:pimeloyl-ACP methyl ester carboxylesterase
MSPLVWGPEVSSNARHSVNLYRANILQHLRNPVAWRTSVPVQLVVAKRDPWVTPRAVAGMEARCRQLSTVEVDQGHWLPRTKPTEFAELVAEFVRRVRTPPRLNRRLP